MKHAVYIRNVKIAMHGPYCIHICIVARNTQSGKLRAAIVYVIARPFRQCQTPQSAHNSAVYYLYHLKSNNIIGQRENHHKKKHLQMIDFIELKTFKQQILVISCQEQINGLLVVIHHQNIHELTSIRLLKLNLKCQNIKMRRKIFDHLFLFFHEIPLNHHHAIGYHSCFYSCSLF